VECCVDYGQAAAKLLIRWRPRRDLNPCYRRERLFANHNCMTLLAQEPFGKAPKRSNEQ
jgi:hypothetical protein